MTGHGAKFGRKMEAAVAALLTHRNTEEVAKSIGVGYKTLLRWQQIPDFQAALRRAQQDAFRNTTARLQQAAPAAASVLLKVMMDPATPASVRVRAAEGVLNHTEKALELQDVEARLSQLERAADENKPGWRKN
jgi:hypothetical protein